MHIVVVLMSGNHATRPASLRGAVFAGAERRGRPLTN